MFVTARAWWPGMREMIKRHIKWCGLCDAKIKASRLSGHGQVSVCSFRHVGADHKILPEWLAKIVGMAAVLVFSDKASRKTTGSLGGTLVESVAERSRELIASYQAHNNERNYLASYERDSEVQFKRKSEMQFVKGDAVTWINKNKNPEHGVVVFVRVIGGVPMSAVVETAGGGQRKKIQYNQLKGKSARRPQLLIGDAVRLEVGSLGFWRDGEGELVGAQILELIEDQLLVHYHMENHNLRTWLPLWTLVGTDENYRCGECPDGCAAAEEVIPATMIEMTGRLKDTGYIEEDSLLRLQAWLQD